MYILQCTKYLSFSLDAAPNSSKKLSFEWALFGGIVSSKVGSTLSKARRRFLLERMSYARERERERERNEEDGIIDEQWLTYFNTFEMIVSFTISTSLLLFIRMMYKNLLSICVYISPSTHVIHYMYCVCVTLTHMPS